MHSEEKTVKSPPWALSSHVWEALASTSSSLWSPLFPESKGERLNYNTVRKAKLGGHSLCAEHCPQDSVDDLIQSLGQACGVATMIAPILQMTGRS